MFRFVSAFVAVVLCLSGCGGDDECSTSGDVVVCGSFGKPLWIAAPERAPDVSWPPVAAEDGRLWLASGRELLHIGADGEVATRASHGDRLLAPPSLAGDGGLYTVADDFDTGVQVRALVADGREAWTTDLEARGARTPATVGPDRIHVAIQGDGWDLDPKLFDLDPETGRVLR